MKSLVFIALLLGLIWSQTPDDFAKQLQAAQQKTFDTTEIIKKLPVPLKRCCKSSIPDPFSEKFQTIATLSNVDYYQTSSTPYPGFYALLASGTTGIVPWQYHQCPNDGKHLYVNGMNTNWNPSYRRIFTYKGILTKGVTYRFCFMVRNLPSCSPWDAKPFGYIAYTTTAASSIGYWNANIVNLTGCVWKEVVSDKFIGTGTLGTISIMLYNGWYADGNDLVMDNVRIVALPAQPLLSIFAALGSYNGVTYSFLASSATLPSDNCLDYWYLYNSTGLISQGVATPSTSIEFTLPGLSVNVLYTVKIRRVCDCSTDSYWSTSFIVYNKATPNQPVVEKLVLQETNTNAFTVSSATAAATAADTVATNGK